MNRKWLFVLPNLFTVSSIFCGIYSVTLVTSAQGPQDAATFWTAAIAILFGAFFDGCDGRVARLTRTESDFGIQLDSLADVITFGAAPALLMYKWALAPLGAVPAVAIAGIYASCGALRLARFNVMAGKSAGPSEYFTGLPIPLAAAMIVSLVVAATGAPEPQVVGAVPAAVLTLVLSYLMVSNIRFQSFKKLRLHARELVVIGLVLVLGAIIAVRVRPSFVLVAYASAYVLFGLVEEILFRHRRPRELELATPSRTVVVEADEDED
jgi:CDP-diacylglycerol--serine O-phosphatidyltransferase